MTKKQVFSEAQIIELEHMMERVAERVVRRFDEQGFFNHDHEEGEMVNYAERDIKAELEARHRRYPC